MATLKNLSALTQLVPGVSLAGVAQEGQGIGKARWDQTSWYRSPSGKPGGL